MRDIVVFSGSAHRDLAEAVCNELGVPLSPSETVRFSNDCLQVQLLANCRQRDVYIVQPLVPPELAPPYPAAHVLHWLCAVAPVVVPPAVV